MDFIFDPSLVLYLPLYELHGASFKSRDKHGHLCTVTGALWKPNGRLFDGADDYLTLTGVLSNLAACTLQANFRMHRLSSSDVVVGQTNLGGAQDAMGFYTNAQQIVLDVKTSSGRVTRNMGAFDATSWANWAGTYDGANIIGYKDAVATAPAAQTGSTSSGKPFVIGARGEDYGFLSHVTVGDVLVYNRALSPLEIQHNYLATKWRYQ